MIYLTSPNIYLLLWRINKSTSQTFVNNNIHIKKINMIGVITWDDFFSIIFSKLNFYFIFSLQIISLYQSFFFSLKKCSTKSHTHMYTHRKKKKGLIAK